MLQRGNRKWMLALLTLVFGTLFAPQVPAFGIGEHWHGLVLICNTPEQVEQFVQIHMVKKVSKEEAIEQINRPTGMNACGIARVGWNYVGRVKTLTVGMDRFTIHEVMVVEMGIRTPKGTRFTSIGRPEVQYIFTKEEGEYV